jgi:hypothetical protein
MGLFDAILGHAHDHPTVKNLAQKLGIEQEQAEQAIAALAEAHRQQGDTVSLASNRTGLPTETLSRVIEQIGGEGSLTQFNQMLEGDHGANPFDNFNGN